MRQLLTMVGNDLRQRVRDRSVLIMGILVPLSLMFVMNLVFGGMEEPELGSATVAASVAEDDELGQAVVDVLTQIEVIDVTVDRVAADQVRPRAEAGEAQLGIIVPAGFSDDVTSGQGATLEMVEGDGAGLETDILISVIDGVTTQMTAATVTATAGAQAGPGVLVHPQVREAQRHGAPHPAGQRDRVDAVADDDRLQRREVAAAHPRIEAVGHRDGAVAGGRVVQRARAVPRGVG